MEIPLYELVGYPRCNEAVTATLDLATALLGPATYVLGCVDDGGMVVVRQRDGDRIDLADGQQLSRLDPIGGLIFSVKDSSVVLDDVGQLSSQSDPSNPQDVHFLGVPVTLSNGRRFGTIARIAASPPGDLDAGRSHLESLARLLASAIDAERTSGMDALTGLYSRALLDDHLTLELARSRRNGQHLAVVIMSFDPPQEWCAGDHRRWLKQVGERLRSSVREGDTAARIGSTEFALIVPDLRDLGSARRVAQSLLDSLDDPYISESDVFSVTPSIGVSLVPWDGYDPDTLILRAARAVEKARAAGGRSFHLYSEHRYLRVVPWE